jgi:hypothetical protein
MRSVLIPKPGEGERCLRKAKERTKVEVHVSDRTKRRMDAKNRELTPRSRGQSPTKSIERINVYLRGRSA